MIISNLTVILKATSQLGGYQENTRKAPSKKKMLILVIISSKREMLGTLLVFFWCPPNCDMPFKIINRLKVNNNNIKFNSDFKSHITIGRTSGKH
jgi:hypothetical protein